MFDPIAFIMGPGARGDLVSSLMGKGGGGGSSTLEESGWIKTKGNNTVVEGNLVTMTKGSALQVAPPVDVRASNRFEVDDVFECSFTVTVNSRKFGFGASGNGSNGTVTSKTGYMVISNPNFASSISQIESIGSDTVTFTIVKGYISAFTLAPKLNDGATSYSDNVTVEITGMRFNGTKII